MPKDLKTEKPNPWLRTPSLPTSQKGFSCLYFHVERPRAPTSPPRPAVAHKHGKPRAFPRCGQWERISRKRAPAARCALPSPGAPAPATPPPPPTHAHARARGDALQPLTPTRRRRAPRTQRGGAAAPTSGHGAVRR